MDASWATWALQFLIVLGVGRVWLAIDNNTKELSDLREEIPKTYATKVDTDRHHDEDASRFKELHERLDTAGSRIHGVDLRVTAMDSAIKQVQAG